MFASRVRSTVVIGEDETAVNVQIRKLSARSLEKASEARQIGVAQLSRNFGAEVLRAFQSEKDDKTAEKEKKPFDPVAAKKARYTTYDRQLVLTQGVVSWDAKDATGRPLPLNGEDGLADLDEDAAKKLHEAILDLSLPPVQPEEAEAQAKNA